MNINRIAPGKGLTPVDYLDTVSSIEMAKQYKAYSFELLDIKSNDFVLEVGCGNGDDCYNMSKKVGPQGKVIGIDINPAMISEAWKRYANKSTCLEFKLLDIHNLPYENSVFDACRADRVFQHLVNPQKALHEVYRVLKTGGKALIVDPDWETLVIDHEDKETTRTLVNYLCDKCVPFGWIGRQLPGLYKNAGFKNINIIGQVFTVNSLKVADMIWGLESYLATAVDKNVISRDKFENWRKSLLQKESEGTFFSSVTGFISVGEKL